MANNHQAKVMSPEEVSQLPRKPIPESMKKAAGLLKYKYGDLLKHYQKIRKEWPSYEEDTKR